MVAPSLGGWRWSAFGDWTAFHWLDPAATGTCRLQFTQTDDLTHGMRTLNADRDSAELRRATLVAIFLGFRSGCRGSSDFCTQSAFALGEGAGSTVIRRRPPLLVVAVADVRLT